MKLITTLAALMVLLSSYPAAGAQATAVNTRPQGAPSVTAPQERVPPAAVKSVERGTGVSPAVGQMPIDIEYHGTSKVPARSLFRTLRSRFAGGWLGPYQVVSSDRRSGTLVIRRNAIDADNWSKWAYCEVGPLDMLDSLRDGAVTVTIKLKPARRITYTSTAANFEGTYGLTAASKNVACMSRGVLEDNILTTIAAENPPRTGRLAKRRLVPSNRHRLAHLVA